MPTIITLSKTQTLGQKFSSPFAIPKGAKGTFTVQADMNSSDLIDSSKQISLSLEIEISPGVWQFFAGITYVGGVYPQLVSPGFYFDIAEIAGKNTRVSVNASKITAIGAKVTY